VAGQFAAGLVASITLLLDSSLSRNKKEMPMRKFIIAAAVAVFGLVATLSASQAATATYKKPVHHYHHHYHHVVHHHTAYPHAM